LWEQKQCDGIIFPGGESSAIALVAQRWGLVRSVRRSFLCRAFFSVITRLSCRSSSAQVEPLQDFVRSGKPVFGTCAGLILIANDATNQKEGGQPLLGGLDITVERNAYGRQIASFESHVQVAADLDAYHAGKASGAAASSDTSKEQLQQQPQLISSVSSKLAPAVFIRAPGITRVGPGVEVTCRWCFSLSPLSLLLLLLLPLHLPLFLLPLFLPLSYFLSFFLSFFFFLLLLRLLLVVVSCFVVILGVGWLGFSSLPGACAACARSAPQAVRRDARGRDQARQGERRHVEGERPRTTRRQQLQQREQ
jgi:glutamine amidotransferase PdxT